MLMLEDIITWLKTLKTKFSNYYIGTLNSKKDDSLGIYNLKRSIQPIQAIGIISSYNIKRVSLLVHCTKDTVETEKKAYALYEEIMNSRIDVIGGHHVQFIGMLTNEPIDVGKDENGICEYVIEFEIYYKRNKEE